jgi:hypothetical protein
MANLSRRHFLVKASIGAVTVGALARVPGYTFAPETAHASAGHTALHAGTVLAHIRDADTGEIAVLVGTREIVVFDRAVARRLLRATM